MVECTMPNSSSPLVLILLSVEHLTPERRAEIGTVFDAHPLLRPGKVGQDPPRTRVGSTLVPHLAEPDLPLFLFGGEGARTEESATWIFELEPAWIVVGGRGDAEEVVRPVSSLTIAIGPERAAALGAHGLEVFLGEIGDAIGAAYGCIFPEATYDQLNRWYSDGPARPDLSWGLGSVYWMQYLGPAFVERRPALAQLERSATTPRGAVIHRATEQPEHSLENSGSPLEGEWRAPLLSALGEDVILISLEERDTMPSLEHHASFDPGRVGPPEDLVRRTREDAERRRRRREAEYDRARTRRLRLEGRRTPPHVHGMAEWSTNVDADEVPRFWRTLRESLAPEITSPYAGALGREIANTPTGAGDRVEVDSPHGPFAVAWWSDDEESLVLALEGPGDLVERWEDFFEAG